MRNAAEVEAGGCLNGGLTRNACGVSDSDPKAGIRPEGAADAVPEELRGGCRREILCRYMLATSGANIVCIPEVTLKSLKIRR